MRFEIDTDTATITELSLASNLLSNIAEARSATPRSDVEVMTQGVEAYPSFEANLQAGQEESQQRHEAAKVFTTLATVSVAATPAVAGAPMVAAVTQTALAGASAPRDLAGQVWDPRIHSESRAQNKDGTWRFRRNLDEAVKASVIAEYAAKAAPTVNDECPGCPPKHDAVPLPPTTVSVPTPPSMGVPNAPQPIVVSEVTPFMLMSRLSKLMGEGKLTQPVVMSICQSLGLASITELLKKPELLPQFAKMVDDRVS